MTAAVRPRQSATPGKVPTAQSLAVGEVAVNTADAKVFLRCATGVVEVGSGSGDAAAAAAASAAASAAAARRAAMVMAIIFGS